MERRRAVIGACDFRQLVLGGWNPDEERTLPPLTHKEFAQQFKLWIESGLYAPDSISISYSDNAKGSLFKGSAKDCEYLKIK